MKKNRELTPVKVLLIYSIALVLVVFHELPRVHSWMQETRWAFASGEIFDGFHANPLRLVSKASDPSLKTDQAQNDTSRETGSEVMPEAQAAEPGPVPGEDAGQAIASPDPIGAGHETTPAAQSAPRTENGETPSKFKPHKVLLVGDSMIAEGFGPALQRRLKKQSSVEVVREGQYSTGFVHQEDFNWTSVLKEFVQEHKPDMIVIHMGANDPIDILDGSGKRLYCGNDRWQEVYASRVREFLKVASDKEIHSFWVGLPIMSSDKYCSKISVINAVAERECAKVSGCVYLNSWPALADSTGKYTAYIKGPGGKQTRIRAKDNVHLTEAGGAMLTDYFLRAVDRYVDLSAADEHNPDTATQ